MLSLSNIYKSFEEKQVLKDISFGAEAGEIIALLGPSGCGKTTLLRIVAGLETVDRGQLALDGTDLTEVPVYKRGFGMVFQDYALFPHKTAAQNIAFGLKMAGWTAHHQRYRVEQLLDLVGLAGMGDRQIFDLSGGEQQRVALARALAPNPRLLLLDEPLGALDRSLRERLMTELRAILVKAAEIEGQQQVTTIYVTHDQEEAFAVADRVMVMNAGRIEQSGTPVELFRSPKTPFVARFLGMDNLIPAKVVAERPCRVETPIGEIILDEDCQSRLSKGLLLIRPEAAEIISESRGGENEVNGRVLEISFRGRYQVVQVAVGETILKLTFDFSESLPEKDSLIQLVLLPGKCRYFSVD